jgi:integrase/recombinase XerC
MSIDRIEAARKAAIRRGLQLIERGAVLTLRDGEAVVHRGGISDIESHLAARPGRRPGGKPKPECAAPPAWAQMIDDYLAGLNAIGRREATIECRRFTLRPLARGLGCPPEAVTGELLVDWFGQQTHWAVETRRMYRNAARSFFKWAYKSGRLPVDLSDAVAKVRQLPPSARPASDQAWSAALLAADARVTLMLRLAGEAGMRRGEVAQVHYRDLIEGVDGAQLLVHGKGGKNRVVPISESLAGLLRQGAAGHTPGMPVEGWLFPSGHGGHLTVGHVGGLVGRALPPGFTMHALRHRFASRAYRGTRNLRAVQVLLGHQSIATTERYCAVNDSEVRAAMMAAGE